MRSQPTYIPARSLYVVVFVLCCLVTGDQLVPNYITLAWAWCLPKVPKEPGLFSNFILSNARCGSAELLINRAQMNWRCLSPEQEGLFENYRTQLKRMVHNSVGPDRMEVQETQTHGSNQHLRNFFAMCLVSLHLRGKVGRQGPLVSGVRETGPTWPCLRDNSDAHGCSVSCVQLGRIHTQWSENMHCSWPRHTKGNRVLFWSEKSRIYVSACAKEVDCLKVQSPFSYLVRGPTLWNRWNNRKKSASQFPTKLWGRFLHFCAWWFCLSVRKRASRILHPGKARTFVQNTLQICRHMIW